MYEYIPPREISNYIIKMLSVTGTVMQELGIEDVVCNAPSLDFGSNPTVFVPIVDTPDPKDFQKTPLHISITTDTEVTVRISTENGLISAPFFDRTPSMEQGKMRREIGTPLGFVALYASCAYPPKSHGFRSPFILRGELPFGEKVVIAECHGYAFNDSNATEFMEVISRAARRRLDLLRKSRGL